MTGTMLGHEPGRRKIIYTRRHMGQVFPFICAILVKSPFHVFIGAILNLEASKHTIISMDMGVDIRPDKKIMVQTPRKIDELAKV